MRFIELLGSGGRSTLITAALVSVASGSLAAQRDTVSGSVLRGRVIDALSALPLSGVNVIVTAGSDTLGRGQSDVVGAFVLTGLRATTPTVMTHFARDGYHGDSLSTNLSAGSDALEPIRVAMIPTTKVVASRRTGPPLTGADDFDRRAAHHGEGLFLTEADIERRSPVQTSDLLRGISGIALDDSAGVLRLVSTRGSLPNFLSAMSGATASSGATATTGATGGTSSHPATGGTSTGASSATTQASSPQRCTMSIGVDGQLMDANFTVDEMPPTMIHGIEIYLGASTVPIQYTASVGNGAVCGLIMIWTRTGNDGR